MARQNCWEPQLADPMEWQMAQQMAAAKDCRMAQKKEEKPSTAAGWVEQSGRCLELPCMNEYEFLPMSLSNIHLSLAADEHG